MILHYLFCLRWPVVKNRGLHRVEPGGGLAEYRLK